MISALQMRDLEKRVPPALLKRGQGNIHEGPKEALQRWASARGFDQGFRFSYLRGADDDELFGFAIAGHVCLWALLTQVAVEIEQERSMRIASSAQRSAPTAAPLESRSILLASLRRIGDIKPGSWGARTNLSALAKQRLDSLVAARAKQRSDEDALADYVDEFDAMRQQFIVPLVASGYLNDPRRGGKLAERMCLLFQLTNMGIPLLRAMAMIGELRLGTTPVVFDHPERDARFGRNKDQLKRLRALLKKARGRSEPTQSDRPLARRGKKRDNRQRAATKRNSKRARPAHRR